MREPPQSAGQPRPTQEDEPMLWRPVCSTRLTSRKCQLLCHKRGYTMSYADYY
jgi:hypothetical protein